MKIEKSATQNRKNSLANAINNDSKISKPEDMHKPFKNNLFLNIVLDNKQWKNNLKTEVISKHGDFHIDKNCLTVKCTLSEENRNFYNLAANWTKNMNQTISNFMKDFHHDNISLVDHNLDSLRETIKEFNNKNGFCVQYKQIEEKLHYVVYKSALEQFRSAVQNASIVKPKSVQYQLPLLENELYSLTDPLLHKLKLKFPDIQIINDSVFRRINLNGPQNRVDEFQKLLDDYFRSIRSDKLRSINEEALNCANMINILEKIAEEKQILCKFSKKNDGFYIIYFQNNSCIESQKIETFTRVETHIMQNYTCSRIDFLNSNNEFNGQKWSSFKNNHLTSNQDITFSNVNSKEIIIFGKKEMVFTLEAEIQKFLETNKQITKHKLRYFKNEVRAKFLIKRKGGFKPKLLFFYI